MVLASCLPPSAPLMIRRGGGRPAAPAYRGVSATCPAPPTALALSVNEYTDLLRPLTTIEVELVHSWSLAAGLLAP